MAILELPTKNDLPAYKYTIPLEGTTYTLDFNFNDRMGKWFLQISDIIGTVIVGPVPVIASMPLFNRFKIAGLPLGTLFAFDTSGANLDPGRFELGDRVRLLYRESTT